MGFCNDVEAEIVKCNYAYFPSRYREGSPRFLIEASSYGLNIITTKAPGCDYYINHHVAYSYENVPDVLKWIKGRTHEDYLMRKKDTISFYEKNFTSNMVFEEFFKYIIS